MNRFQALTGLSLAGFVALLATNLGPIIDALAGLPKVLDAFAEALPLGTGTFFLVLVVSGALWAKCKQLSHNEFVCESGALAVAIGAMLALNAALPPPHMPPSASALKAVMLGILAGLAAPYVMKGLGVLWRWLVANVVGTEDKPPCV